jgi:hypothetical protein
LDHWLIKLFFASERLFCVAFCVAFCVVAFAFAVTTTAAANAVWSSGVPLAPALPPAPSLELAAPAACLAANTAAASAAVLSLCDKEVCKDLMYWGVVCVRQYVVN